MRIIIIQAALTELCLGVRFLKLPPNFTLPPGRLRTELDVFSERDCGQIALTAELQAGNVTHFVFESASSPACIIYDDVVSSEMVQDSSGRITFVKQAAGFTYGGGCISEEQSKEAVKALLSETSLSTPKTTAIISRSIPAVTTTAKPNATTRTPTTESTTTIPMSTTSKPTPCTASVEDQEAGVIFDDPGLTRVSRGPIKNATVECPCTAGATRFGRQEFWQSLSSGNHVALSRNSENVIDLSCARKQDLCICDEQSVCFIPGAEPADRLVLFPLCGEDGCHVYALQSTTGYNGTGGNGASLNSDQITMFEKNQFTARGGLKDVANYNPAVYIQAAAISCRGCSFILNDKEATCSLDAG